MSIKAAHRAAQPAAASIRAERRALRLALGTAVGFTAATALDWPAALLSPILFIQLSVGLPRCPGLALALRTIAAIATCVFIGWLVTFTIAMPLLCTLLIALLLFAAFWVQAGSRAGLAPFVLMIGVCVLPVLAVQAPELATVLAVELVKASAVAFLLVWGTWALFPDPEAPATSSGCPRQPPQAPSAPVARSPAGPGTRDRARIAVINTLVVMPVVLAFLLFELSSAVVALITALAIVRAQTNAVRLGMTGGLLEGNLVAGSAAVVSTAVIYAAPSLLMLFGIVLLTALMFASRLTAASAVRAPVWVTGIISTVALLDGSLSALSEGAGAAAWSRVINLSAAILYVTAALRLTASLRPLGPSGTLYNA
jgi:Protein of unknown function (DUF2955)